MYACLGLHCSQHWFEKLLVAMSSHQCRDMLCLEGLALSNSECSATDGTSTSTKWWKRLQVRMKKKYRTVQVKMTKKFQRIQKSTKKTSPSQELASPVRLSGKPTTTAHKLLAPERNITGYQTFQQTASLTLPTTPVSQRAIIPSWTREGCTEA